MRGGGFLYSRHRGWGFIGPLPTDLQKPPPQNNRAGELGPLPSQGVLLTQYTVFHNILCHYALRVKCCQIIIFASAAALPTEIRR